MIYKPPYAQLINKSFSLYIKFLHCQTERRCQMMEAFFVPTLWRGSPVNFRLSDDFLGGRYIAVLVSTAKVWFSALDTFVFLVFLGLYAMFSVEISFQGTFCAIPTPILWHIFGAYLLQIWGGGGGQKCFHAF